MSETDNVVALPHTQLLYTKGVRAASWHRWCRFSIRCQSGHEVHHV